MELWTRFDIPFVLRQVGILALVVAAPPILFSVLQVRRRLFISAALVGGLAVWALLSWQVVSSSLAIWEGDPVPITPLPIGPSYLSIREFVPVAAVVWLPWALYATVAVLRRRRRLVDDARDGRRVAIMTLYFIYSALWLGFFLFALEYSHEDTMYAEGFTKSRWDSVSKGMTEEQISAILGPPLAASLQPAFAIAQGATCWVRNWSAGHFACVWFERQKSVRVYRWYSD